LKIEQRKQAKKIRTEALREDNEEINIIEISPIKKKKDKKPPIAPII